MTDTRARDALATALIRTGIFIDGGRDDPRVYASVLLRDEDITPDDRRALAAAFLDAETLGTALGAIAGSPVWSGNTTDWREAAAAILAALRETP